MRAVRLGGCRNFRRCSICWKRSRSSAISIMSGVVPMIGTPFFSRSRASLSGVCPPYCTMTPMGFSTCDDLQHVLERDRLEIQAVGRIVVGRHGLRIAVDHDRLVAVFAQCQRRVHAAIVELDALADAVGAAAEHDHFLAVGRRRLALLFVRRIHVGRAAWRTPRRTYRRACTPAGCRAHGDARARRSPSFAAGVRAGGRRTPCASGRAARQPKAPAACAFRQPARYPRSP